MLLLLAHSMEHKSELQTRIGITRVLLVCSFVLAAGFHTTNLAHLKNPP